jgi:hypothetical protein
MGLQDLLQQAKGKQQPTQQTSQPARQTPQPTATKASGVSSLLSTAKAKAGPVQGPQQPVVTPAAPQPERTTLGTLKGIVGGIWNVTKNVAQAVGTNEGRADIAETFKEAGVPALKNTLYNYNEMFYGGAKNAFSAIGADTLAGFADVDKKISRAKAKQANDEVRSFLTAESDPNDTRGFLEKLQAADGEKEISKIIGVQLPTFMAIIGTGVLSRGASLPSAPGVLATSFALNSGDAYQQGKDYLESTGQALTPENERVLQRVAMLTGATLAPLDTLGMERILSTAGASQFKKSLVKNIMHQALQTGTNVLVEGGTEALQEVVQNAWAKTYNENQSLWEGVAEAAFGGSLFGGGATITLHSAGLLRTGIMERLKKGDTPEDVIKQIEEAAKDAKVPAGREDIAEIVSEVAEEHESVIENDVRAPLRTGATPAAVAFGLSQKMSVDEATQLVERIAAETPKQAPEITETALDEATEAFEGIDTKVTKNVAERASQKAQQEAKAEQKKLTSDVAQIKATIKELEQKLRTTPARSNVKRTTKLALEKARRELRAAERVSNKGVQVFTPKEVKKLPPLDRADYRNFIEPKLRGLPTPKEDEALIIFGGKGRTGQYVDTYPAVALNRGVNKNTTIMVVKKSRLVSTGDKAKDARGERLLKDDQRSSSGPSSSTGKPSNKIVAHKRPSTGSSPSSVSRTTAVGTEGVTGSPKVSRYVAPSNSSSRSSIPLYITTVREQAQANLSIFEADIEAATGVKPIARVKAADSLEGKVERTLAEGRKLEEINDVLAARVILPLDQASETIKKVEASFDVERTKNYFERPSPWGYRGANIVVKLPDGAGLAEIQIHSPESLKIVDAIHKIYEKWRNLDISKLTADERLAMDADIKEANAIADNLLKPTKESTPASRAKAAEKPIESKGEKRESRAFERIRERLGIEESETYNRLNLAEDTAKAVAFVEQSPEIARRIALGLELPPEGYTETAISIAYAEKMGSEGNFKAQADAERARSLRQTRRGQEIVAERGRVTQNSPALFIQQVIKARLQALGTQNLRFVTGKEKSVKTAATEAIDREKAKVEKRLKDRRMRIQEAQTLLEKLTCA